MVELGYEQEHTEDPLRRPDCPLHAAGLSDRLEAEAQALDVVVTRNEIEDDAHEETAGLTVVKLMRSLDVGAVFIEIRRGRHRLRLCQPQPFLPALSAVFRSPPPPPAERGAAQR